MHNMKLVKAFKLVSRMQESLSSFQISQPNTEQHFCILLTNNFNFNLSLKLELQLFKGPCQEHHQAALKCSTGFVQCLCSLLLAWKLKFRLSFIDPFEMTPSGKFRMIAPSRCSDQISFSMCIGHRQNPCVEAGESLQMCVLRGQTHQARLETS